MHASTRSLEPAAAALLCPPKDLAFILPACAGHPDITKFEWALNIHRDSYASYIGHHNMVSYFSLVQNESIGRSK